MSYSDVSNMDQHLVEVSFFDVKEGQSILYQGTWYRALEDSVVNEGMVGFRAEHEDFTEIVIQTKKTDLGYAPRLYTERVPSTDDSE